MPRKKEKPKNPLLEAIGEIEKTNAVSKSAKNKIVDIITFCDSPRYLDLPNNNFNLWISQRTILKSFYMGSRGNEDLKLNKDEWEWLYANEEDEERDGVKYEKNIKEVIRKLLAVEKDSSGKKK